MKKSFARLCFCAALFLAISCGQEGSKNLPAAGAPEMAFPKGSYGYDASFLKKQVSHIIELQSADGHSKILLSPDFQGRVLTSTAVGDSGISFGWINYALIASGKKKQQFNPVGGEERFWMGPEGGQYSLYFKKADSFTISHWQVPAVVDTAAYQVTRSGSSSVLFSKDARLTNYSNTVFTISIQREVRLLDKKQVEEKINFPLADSIH